LNKQQTRTCTDYNGCGSLVGKPVATQSCANCVPSWQAGTWSTCANSQQTRTVTDTNSCGTTTGKPTTSQSCCSATCLTQSDGVYAIGCSGNVTKCPTGRTCQQTYSTTYVYSNGVAQTVQTLNGSQCICVPSWQTGDWSPTCVNGMQTRTVTDSNNCGVTTNKPATSQACDQT
jgi:hypothetical protein